MTASKFDSRRRDAALARTVERALRDAGLDLVVSARDGVVRLVGAVEAEELAQMAFEVAARHPDVRDVVSEVEVIEPEAIGPESFDELPDLQLHEERVEATEWSGAGDPARSARTGEPWFPPTDPVVRPDAHGQPEVLGGLAATSMDELAEEIHEGEGDERGDEEIEADVRRELAEDALTADLDIDVIVRRGVVGLRGRVAGLEDVDAATEVASRVPGVRYVYENLELAHG